METSSWGRLPRKLLYLATRERAAEELCVYLGTVRVTLSRVRFHESVGKVRFVHRTSSKRNTTFAISKPLLFLVTFHAVQYRSKWLFSTRKTMFHLVRYVLCIVYEETESVFEEIVSTSLVNIVPGFPVTTNRWECECGRRTLCKVYRCSRKAFTAVCSVAWKSKEHGEFNQRFKEKEFLATRSNRNRFVRVTTGNKSKERETLERGHLGLKIM